MDDTRRSPLPRGNRHRHGALRRPVGRGRRAGRSRRHAVVRGVLHALPFRRAPGRLGGSAAGALSRRGCASAATSDALARGKQFAFALVRPGIFLYGGVAAEGLAEPRPVVSVRARVLSVRRIKRGESVSYNASWTAARDTVIATLRCGYAAGRRRTLGPNGASVLLRGQRRPIVGFVQMEMALVETGTLEVQVGDIATIVGEDAKQRITLKELADWSGELQHEFLTGLGARLPRVRR